MNDSADFEARLYAVEGRLDAVESEASAARHLAAYNDRDLADIGVKVEANRRAINALGQQTAEQFADVRTEMRAGFADVRAEMRAGFATIGQQLTVLIEDRDAPNESS